MLKSWSIENFKPIVNSGELKLAPVTILAGRNSSGKSSLLQSILMIAQTLSNQVPDRALLPNERIVQLGTFEDILNEITHSRTLVVSFELEMEKEELKPQLRRRSLSWQNAKSAKVAVKFSSASGDSISSSAIEASKVVVEGVSIEINSDKPTILLFGNSQMDTQRLIFDIRKVTDAELQQFLKTIASEYLRLIPYGGEHPNYLGKFEMSNEAARNKIFEQDLNGAARNKAFEQYLVALSHFLPTRLVRKFKIEVHRKRYLEHIINRLFEYPNSSVFSSIVHSDQFPDLIDLEAPISEDLKKAVNELCKSKNIPGVSSTPTLRELAHWYKSLKVEGRGGKKTAIREKLQEIIVQNTLKTDAEKYKFPEGLEAIANDLYTDNLEYTVEQVTRFFTSKVRYLGPLRADPQVSQKFAPSSEIDDIGAKGEYAAAVYDANQIALIEWYNPNTNQIERGTLKEALNNWAQYIDVANEVRTEMAGLSGVTWKVVLKEGRKARSLSEVGVGVSQVLPILVMGLLAPANTLLIIEQPELHLHANVQARLGDFFVGLSKCKKQCMIETHSENLVSQLRYHIVQSGGQDKSDCMIYFVDQDEKGAAKFERIEISARGNILNWPSGFFDESMHQEDKITAASIRRRAKLATND